MYGVNAVKESKIISIIVHYILQVKTGKGILELLGSLLNIVGQHGEYITE